MRSLVLCVFLGLTYALEKETKDLTDQSHLKLQLPKAKRQNRFDYLPSNPYGSIILDTITAGSNILPELRIPSVSNVNYIGRSRGISQNQNLNVEFYPTSNLGNYFYSPNFGKYLSHSTHGSNIVTIPTQKLDSVSNFNGILNVDTSFDARLRSSDVKPLKNANSVVNSIPDNLKTNYFSAVSTRPAQNKFQVKSINFGNGNQVLSSDLGNLDIFRAGTKLKPKAAKSSFSIEKASEVASFYSTGPLIPSDFRQLFERSKYYAKSAKAFNIPIIQEIPAKFTESPKSNPEKSDDEVLGLIEERIRPKSNEKENKSTILSAENNNTSTTNNPLVEDNTENSGHENSITEQVDDDDNSENSVKTSEEFQDIIESYNLINSKSLESRTSEELDRTVSSITISANNGSLSTLHINNSHENLLNETVTGSSIPVRKLNATSFINANDIFNEQYTQLSKSGLEKSNENHLEPTEEKNHHNGQKKENENNISSVESNITLTTSKPLEEEYTEILSQENYITKEVANNSVSTSSKGSDNDSNQDVPKIDNSSTSTLSIESRRSDELDEPGDSMKISLKNSSSILNINTENVSNETTLVSVKKLDASSFVNASEILKERISEVNQNGLSNMNQTDNSEISAETTESKILLGESPSSTPTTCACKLKINKNIKKPFTGLFNATENLNTNLTKIQSRTAEYIDVEKIAEPLSLKSVDVTNSNVDSLEYSKNSENDTSNNNLLTQFFTDIKVNQSNLLDSGEFSENNTESETEFPPTTESLILLENINETTETESIIDSVITTESSTTIAEETILTTQASEVASFYSTGPLVPSDFRQLFERRKYYAKSAKAFNIPIIQEIPAKFTESPKSKPEKSDDEVLELIEERIRPKSNEKENKSTLLSAENNNTSTTNNPLVEDNTENSGHENSITEQVDDDDNSDNSVKTSEEFQDIIESYNLINSKSLESRTSEELDRTVSSITISANDGSLSTLHVNNSHENLLNETVTGSSIPVRKLNATSFINANDIFKDQYTQLSKSGQEKSNENFLELTEERNHPNSEKKENGSNISSVESNITLTTSKPLEEEYTEILSQENYITKEVANNSVSTSSKGSDNDSNQDVPKIDNSSTSTLSIESRRSDELDESGDSMKISLKNSSSILNKNTENVSNGTTLVSVKKLDASSFVNASEILKERISEVNQNGLSDMNQTDNSEISAETTESKILLGESPSSTPTTCACKLNINKNIKKPFTGPFNATENLNTNLTKIQSRTAEYIDVEKIAEPLSLKSVDVTNSNVDSFEYSKNSENDTPNNNLLTQFFTDIKVNQSNLLDSGEFSENNTESETEFPLTTESLILLENINETTETESIIDSVITTESSTTIAEETI